MTAGIILREIFRDMVIMFFLRWLVVGDYRNVKRRDGICLLFIIGICILLRITIRSGPVISIASKLIIFVTAVKIFYKKPLLYGFRYTLIVLVFIDLLNIVSTICAFPFIHMAGIMPHTKAVGLAIFTMRCICYLAGSIIMKKGIIPLRDLTKEAQIGVVLTSILLEFAFVVFKSMRYNLKDVLLYRILLFVVLLGCMILIFWFIDKREEQRRMRELISYTHKTREVIPSVGRMLNRLEELSDHVEKTDEIIKELRSICQTDMQMTQKEMSQIKTFDSTGSPALDEQLKGYLEEASKKGFNLDVIVMAPVEDILNHGEISTYKLVQMVGDLYRNAYKVVTKRKGDGNILICFGYNEQGCYEISIHDNGDPFSTYILKNLGKRGVTTGGTGHGLADIFEVVNSQNASFVLNQKPNEKSIFTKGICIIFDNENRIEINVR